MKISIVITAYNVGEYLEECLNSVINQTYKDIDVFIVEDCSTDNTKDIINKFMDMDKRIHLIQNNINVGSGISRRNGIEAALQNSNSDYIMVLDGDDYLSLDFIEDLANTAEKTGADIVSGGITILRENGIVDTTSYGDPIIDGPDKVFKFWGERIVFMNNKLIRKSIHEKVPYCHRRYIEDTPVIIPQLYYANYVAYNKNVGYMYRMRSGSLTHESDNFKNALYRALCAKDLIKFFSDKEPEYSKFVDLERAYLIELNKLKQCNFTKEDINKYLDDYLDLSINIIKDLNFN